jgi:selenocysteine lyase/cysteine desulfurase
MDLTRLGQHCRQNNILFCIDAIQSVGAVQFDVQAYQADFVMADGHKWMLGPEGLALFYCRAELREQLQLHQYGWHMVEHAHDFSRSDWRPAPDARRFECGSPNMLGGHALRASLSLLLEVGMPMVEKQLLEKTQYLFSLINRSQHLELITSAQAGRYAGIVTFSHQKADHEALYSWLMSQGVMCALRGGGIRYSPHFYTPLSTIESAIVLADKYAAD